MKDNTNRTKTELLKDALDFAKRAATCDPAFGAPGYFLRRGEALRLAVTDATNAGVKLPSTVLLPRTLPNAAALVGIIERAIVAERDANRRLG